MIYWESRKKQIKQIARIASEASKALIFGKKIVPVVENSCYIFRKVTLLPRQVSLLHFKILTQKNGAKLLMFCWFSCEDCSPTFPAVLLFS